MKDQANQFGSLADDPKAIRAARMAVRRLDAMLGLMIVLFVLQGLSALTTYRDWWVFLPGVLGAILALPTWYAWKSSVHRRALVGDVSRHDADDDALAIALTGAAGSRSPGAILMTNAAAQSARQGTATKDTAP